MHDLRRPAICLLLGTLLAGPAAAVEPKAEPGTPDAPVALAASDPVAAASTAAPATSVIEATTRAETQPIAAARDPLAGDPPAAPARQVGSAPPAVLPSTKAASTRATSVDATPAQASPPATSGAEDASRTASAIVPAAPAASAASTQPTAEPTEVAGPGEQEAPAPQANTAPAAAAARDVAAPSQAAGAEASGAEPTPPATTAADSAAPSARPDEAETAAAPPAPALPPLAEAVRLRLEQLTASDAEEEKDERGALAAFYATRSFAPVWVGPIGFTPRGEALAAEIANAGAWGLTPADYVLPALDAKPGTDTPRVDAVAGAEVALSLEALRYARDARGGRMDPNRLSHYITRKPPLLPPAEVLAGLAGNQTPDAYLRGLHPAHEQFGRLRKAWLALGGHKAAGKDAAKALRLLVNMEQWRWMPEDLGRFHVWANAPEFKVRVVRDSEVIHTERMIVGKVTNQTPVFSDEMETIVFHPTWGVPNSIKVKDILPSLLRNGSVMRRHNLRISSGGRDVDPAAVDWAKVDIRNYHVYQPPGRQNVLGVVKFMFPNDHQTYMHDTPDKDLFNAATRTFSHGCMRIRDPLKFATMLLEEDKGWTSTRIAALARPGGPQNSTIRLSRSIPVHMTYFTASVDEDGKVSYFSDIYGHEKRIHMGIEGKAHLIVKGSVSLSSVRSEIVERASGAYRGGGVSQPKSWQERAFQTW